jgi:hypothetical protein
MRGRLQIIRQAEAGRARVRLSHAYDLFEQALRDVQQVSVFAYTLQADALYLIKGVTSASAWPPMICVLRQSVLLHLNFP